MKLFDEFRCHDRWGLARLTSAQRQAQVAARRVLYTYTDQLWEDAKARQLDPATCRVWTSVAAARDVGGALLAEAESLSRHDHVTHEMPSPKA